MKLVFSMKGEENPKFPENNDICNYQNIIRRSPIFKDCLSSSCGSRSPLIYFLREHPDFSNEATCLLLPSYYCGESVSLISELDSRLTPCGPIFKNEDDAVCAKIEESTRETSEESTIDSFSRRKDGRGTFRPLINKHASEVKHQFISKKILNLLQSITWNGLNFSLESHVSNHSNLTALRASNALLLNRNKRSNISLTESTVVIELLK